MRAHELLDTRETFESHTLFKPPPSQVPAGVVESDCSGNRVGSVSGRCSFRAVQSEIPAAAVVERRAVG